MLFERLLLTSRSEEGHFRVRSPRFHKLTCSEISYHSMGEDEQCDPTAFSKLGLRRGIVRDAFEGEETMNDPYPTEEDPISIARHAVRLIPDVLGHLQISREISDNVKKCRRERGQIRFQQRSRFQSRKRETEPGSSRDLCHSLSWQRRLLPLTPLK